MQQLPSPEPSFSIGLSVVALLALGLVSLALVAVVTVLLASRRPIIPFRQIKAVAVTLLWIVPALAVVGLIGVRAPHVESRSVIHEEFHSTTRPETFRSVPTVTTNSSFVTNSSVANNPVTTTQESSPGVAPVLGESQQSLPLAEKRATDPGQIIANRTSEDRLTSPSAGIGPVSGIDVSFYNSLPVGAALKARETRAGAPEWVGQQPVPGDNGILVSLSSQRFATLPEAERDVTAQAIGYVKEFYGNEFPLTGDCMVPVAIIEQNAVHKLVGESLEKDFGNGIHGTMYRAHLQLELNSQLRKTLHDSWQGQVVEHRLIVLGSMLGLVTLMLATSAGYFRLDHLTGGLYRRRLKFAAASLIAAGSLVALVIA